MVSFGAGVIEPVNISTAANPDGRVDVAAATASSETAMYIYDLAPGQSSCPYHYEFKEEWLLVIAGTVVVRTPDGNLSLDRGDLVRFPAGPTGAHKIMNPGQEPARTLAWSTATVPSVSVYPDSNKLGVWPTEGFDNGRIFVLDSAVEWSHGEEGWDTAD